MTELLTVVALDRRVFLGPISRSFLLLFLVDFILVFSVGSSRLILRIVFFGLRFVGILFLRSSRTSLNLPIFLLLILFSNLFRSLISTLGLFFLNLIIFAKILISPNKWRSCFTFTKRGSDEHIGVKTRTYGWQIIPFIFLILANFIEPFLIFLHLLLGFALPQHTPRGRWLVLFLFITIFLQIRSLFCVFFKPILTR